MDRTRAVSATCSTAFGALAISPRRTKPNSPPAHSHNAERMELPGVDPRRQESSPTTAALITSRPARTSRTCHHRPTTTEGLSLTPMVTKNSPISTSRKGLMSSSTCRRYSVSEISMPATKAPRASDRPASSVSVARPSVISSTLRMNTSDDLARATKRNHLRISFWPKTRITASTTTALSSAMPSSIASFSGGCVSEGMITSNGTTARS